MLTITWQEEIASLKQDLNKEINKISRNSDINVRNHICINNLKSKLERLDEIEKILSIDKYQIVFIGTIGQGKTTAICHIFNLIGDFNVSKTIANKSRNVIETKELLSTGAGRTTICEVILKAAEKTYIEIEPCEVDEMENLIFEFCESIANKDNPNSVQKTIISTEIERAIRNITEMKLRYKKTYDGDKKTEVIDPAKEEFDKLGLDEFKKLALNNSKLESRTTTKIEFNNQNNEQEWIKNTFASINNVEFNKFAIPRKIYLYVSYDILSGSNLSQFNSVVDTKGLDENPIRQDLQKYIENQDTICLFVTPFNDAPEANIRKLIGYHLTSKSKDFHQRFVTLVLPHKNQPEKVNGSDGDWDIGIKIRKEEIQATFRNSNLDFFPKNILFYDALRYYRNDIVKLNTEIYSEEDVQADKNEFIEAIAGVVERRRNILLDEIKNIQESFTRIKSSGALTSSEIKAIETAIQKIKDFEDLSKRVQSFLYQDKGQDKGFVTKYVEYYRTVYPAWNTKHAIHRNFGFYKPRNIDIYYDMKVFAEGINEDEMLKKFTKQSRQELENILNELTCANESLKTFIPELIIQLNSLYDDFISEVGKQIQKEAKKKLSPQNEDSKFWEALINEKGKVKSPGETYTDNVCQTLKYELEKGQSLNTFLEIQAEKYWKKLVIKLLSFFGEK